MIFTFHSTDTDLSQNIALLKLTVLMTPAKLLTTSAIRVNQFKSKLTTKATHADLNRHISLYVEDGVPEIDAFRI